MGGWEFAIIEPKHDTRLRPRSAQKTTRHQTRVPDAHHPSSHGTHAKPPGAAAAGWMVFHTKLQQPGRRNPSAQEVPRMAGKDNHKLHIRRNPRRSGLPTEKSPVGFYTRKPDPSNPKHRAAPTRRPSTSEPPYSLGRNEPGCDGATAAKQPPPNLRFMLDG